MIEKLEDLIPYGTEGSDRLFLLEEDDIYVAEHMPEPVLGLCFNFSEDSQFCDINIFQTMEALYAITPLKPCKETWKKQYKRIRNYCSEEALAFIRKRFNEEQKYMQDLTDPWSYNGTDSIPLNGEVEDYCYFRVTTLCGSTRFKQEFLDIQKRLTLEGRIVISVGLFGHSGDDEVWTEGTKEMLDRMHKKKIDMADGIFVINKGGYIGESTRSEIEYAKEHGKRIEYLEPIIED